MNPPDPSPVPQKSGPSGLAMAGIGCGALVLISLIVGALLLRSCAVKVKEAAVDFKNAKGETVSVDTSAANSGGKVVIKGPDGSTVVGGDPDATLPPRWVPAYPAAQSQSGGVKQETKEAITGTYLARTKDAPDKVKDYFESTLKADGFETEVTTADTDGNESAVITATKDDVKRKVTIMANREKGTTNLVITYQGPK
jgi:hypothetical protein